MSGHKPWRDIRDRIMADPARRARIEAEKQAIDAALALVALREGRGLTQTALAREMGVSQARVSRIERQGNPELATLRNYVAALGGKIEVNAVFPDGRVIPIAGGAASREAIPHRPSLPETGPASRPSDPEAIDPRDRPQEPIAQELVAGVPTRAASG